MVLNFIAGAISPFRNKAGEMAGMSRVIRRFTLSQSARTPYQSLPQTSCKPVCWSIPEC